MKNDSPKNLNCEFAAETLDFLYGELNDAAEKSFHLHLNECSECADEIREFSGLRFSIREWKAAEFDKLSTPEISIPYQTAATKTVETVNSVSLFETIRRYFTFSPVLSGAAAVLIIALMFGLGIFVLNNNEKDSLADSNVPPISNNESAESPQNIVEPDKEIIAKENNESERENPAADSAFQKERKIDKKSEPVRIYSKSNTKRKSQPVKTFEKKSSSIDVINNGQVAENLNNKNRLRLYELPEESEDNSLRLTDLFAELESKD